MIGFLIIAVSIITFLLLSIPFLAIQWSFYKITNKKWDRLNLKIIQAVFRYFIQVTGSHVTVIGKENLSKNQAVLYVANHRSYFDILVGYSSVLSLTGFIAKKEMEKIPLLAQWMLFVNCLFIDRANIREGLKTILEGIEKVKKGVSIWIFPEGTRSTSDDPAGLLPFKEGSLKIAEKSKCPIIPVAIMGTDAIFEKQFPRMKASEVTIIFGKPIMISELDSEHKKFLGAYTRQLIVDMIKEQMSQRGAD